MMMLFALLLTRKSLGEILLPSPLCPSHRNSLSARVDLLILPRCHGVPNVFNRCACHQPQGSPTAPIFPEQTPAQEQGCHADVSHQTRPGETKNMTHVRLDDHMFGGEHDREGAPNRACFQTYGNMFGSHVCVHTAVLKLTLAWRSECCCLATQSCPRSFPGAGEAESAERTAPCLRGEGRKQQQHGKKPKGFFFDGRGGRHRCGCCYCPQTRRRGGQR